MLVFEGRMRYNCSIEIKHPHCINSRVFGQQKGLAIMNDYITILLTGGFLAIVDNVDVDLVLRNWHSRPSKHSVYAYNSEQKAMHRIILSRVIGRELLSTEFTDHINHDGLDNRRSNLRLVTHAQNMANKRRMMKSHLITHKGVQKIGQSFVAHICHDGRNCYLGVFTTEIEAGIAYNHAAKEYMGEYACFNDIPDWENITPRRIERDAQNSHIYWHKSRKRWRVKIVREGKVYFYGEFKTLEDAIEKRDEAYEGINKV